MSKIYPVFGIVAPVSYALAIIIGGFLIKGYSHRYNSISELTVSNGPKIPIIFILFFVYNFSLILFGSGLYFNSKIPSATLVKAAFLMLITVGICGIAMLYFVQDPRNVPMTFNGKMHLVLAGISSILTMIVIILLGLGFNKDFIFKGFTVYSFITFAIVFITGGIAGVSVAKDLPNGGLFERLTIGAFMQWVLVLAINLL